MEIPVAAAGPGVYSGPERTSHGHVVRRARSGLCDMVSLAGKQSREHESGVDMRYRLFISALALILVIAASSMVLMRVTTRGTSSANAPSATTAGKTAAAPRTAWGKPDLRACGTSAPPLPWSVPPSSREKSSSHKPKRSNSRSDRPCATIVTRNVPEGNVGDYNQFWYDRGTEVAGTRRTSLIIDPPDGRVPALTPEAQKRKDALTEARRGLDMDAPLPGGWVHDLGPGGLRVRCILGFSSGPPMTPSAYNNNVQLFQTSEHLVILNEMIHDTRIVPLDGRPHGTLRQWAGDSRGRWDGDTLVVDTINFHAAPLSATELSAGMHLVERFKRVDAETLLYEFTVDDPDDVDKAVDRAGSDEEEPTADLRVRMSRRKLQPATTSLPAPAPRRKQRKHLPKKARGEVGHYCSSAPATGSDDRSVTPAPRRSPVSGGRRAGGTSAVDALAAFEHGV